jgi:hypothetical protein
MDASGRGQLLLAYAKGPDRLQAALERYPEESLDFRPEPGKWDIRTTVLHLAESELHGYLRGRTIIAEPGAPVQAFDQDRWADTLDSSAQPLEEAVDLFRLLREMLARQLRSLPEAAWERHMLHPERGRVTLERWLEGYVDHLDAHLAQMERTYQAYRTALA